MTESLPFYEHMTKKIILISIIILATVAVAYAALYSYDRHEKLIEAEKCNDMLSNPPKPTMVTGPDGNPAPLYSLNTCVIMVVPPSLWDLLRGRIIFENVPHRMRVNPYSFKDILLGHYTFSPADMGCDQSGTTTDCSTLPAPLQSEPEPYVPPNQVEPNEKWISATGTPISLYGLSFDLPAGWHGSVYTSAYSGALHALVQSKPNDPGFVIDCPPEGKGLEAATRTSTEQRLFTSSDGTRLSASFEKWTAPGNDPWYFIWVSTWQPGDSTTGWSGNYCLVQGTAIPSVEKAMRTMYESLK